jgi:hypothetical protein
MLSVTRTLLLWSRHAASESGQAMLIVIAALALMATIPVVVITTTVNQLPLTTENLNWNAAYEAAQAGLNDYLQNLDANSSYAKYNKSNPDGNPAFSGWVTVSNDPAEAFEYTPTTNTGSLLLTVSGKAGTGTQTVTRTFQFGLIPVLSTLKYIYWSQYEKIDPALPGSPSNGDNCAYYLGQQAENTACWIVFATGDTINGPVFSNDGFYICGSPNFESTVESSDSYATANYPNYWYGLGAPYSCTNNPTFAAPVAPATTNPSYVSAQTLPGTGASLAAAQALGCVITDSGGGVTFTLSGTTLTWTGGTYSTSSGNSSNECSGGTLYPFSGLQSALYYVNGNVIIKAGATVNGFLTIAASGNITIQGNIQYPAADITGSPTYDTKDALGLIAGGFVDITATSATTIDAALLAQGGSVYAGDWSSPNCSSNPCPNLTIFGSIAQEYRGPVGTVAGGGSCGNGCGFIKHYYYDYSLQVLWPPQFLPATNSTWSPTSYTEIQPGVGNEAVPGT